MIETEFNKGDLVLIINEGSTSIQGLVEEIVSTTIVKVRTTTGTRNIFKTGLRLLKAADNTATGKRCEAATMKCEQLGCRHSKVHTGGNCGHARFTCPYTVVAKKVRCRNER